MRRILCWLLPLLFLLSHTGSAQELQRLSGVVLDAAFGAPLAFVNVVLNQGPTGATTGIDGRFSLPLREPLQQLQFSYVGYVPLTLRLQPGEAAGPLTVRLQSAVTDLEEVVVRPGANPAHRLIRNVTAQRDRHNPEKLPSFRYKSYNKMVLTAAPVAAALSDTLRLQRQPDAKADSAEAEMRALLEKQHLFVMETVTQRDFKAPDRSREVVLASRVSGLQRPNFPLLATDFQPFSFYSDFIALQGQAFVSPISKGSTRRYDFELKDTTYADADTVFIVAYKPLPGKHFAGLRGLLYISTDGWALQNVIAEPAEGDLKGLRIQQQYEKVEGRQWFPVQLNTDFTIPKLELSGHQPVAVSRSYLTQIELAPALRNRDLGSVSVQIDPLAHRQPAAYWQQFRPDSLDARELTTYHTLDSIGRKENLDAKLQIVESLISGRFPLGPVDLDVARLLRVSRYEGLRLGLGLHTSERLLRWATVGGYGAYGFRDKAFKYGADARFFLYRPAQAELAFTWFEDILESGGTRLVFRPQPVLSNNLRPLIIHNMDRVSHRSAAVSFRSLRYLLVQAELRQEEKRPTNGYMFEVQPDVWSSRFRFAEAVLGLRYSVGEKLVQAFSHVVALPTTQPVFWLQYTQGLKGPLDGQYSYQKYDARVQGSFRTAALGLTQYTLAGGVVQGSIPYSNLYNGTGSYSKKVRLFASEGFETMAPGEFLADRYAALFLQQRLGKLLYQSAQFSPDLLLVHNAGIGGLRQLQRHRLPGQEGFPFKTLRRGYYETGLVVTNVVEAQFSSIGFGVFYRYGPYRQPAALDNVVLKAALTLSF